MTLSRILFLLSVTVLPFFSLAHLPALVGDSTLPGASYVKKVRLKCANLSEMMDKKEQKYLNSLLQQERKLKKKLLQKDSMAASRIFSDAESFYERLPGGDSMSINAKKYIPELDSLGTSLSFLTNSSTQQLPNMQEAQKVVSDLKQHFNQAEYIKRELDKRKQFLKDQFTQMGMVKDLKKYNEQLYYYKVQMNEYQNLLKDPSKIEKKALDLLRTSTAYQKFFAKHSQLANMFRLPAGANEQPNITLDGLQSRAMLEQQLGQPLGNLNANNPVSQQAQSGNQQLQKVKNELTNKLGKGKEELDMPAFKKNEQKTKRWFDRLEYGVNVQSSKTNGYFPATSDFAGSIGYKVNDRSTVGIGSSYKLGWGSDIRHIRVSHQGLGLRSFLDIKIKGSFWASGGAEYNYRSAFKNFDILKGHSSWQQSMLLGITKKFSLNAKVKANMQLLYDFLHHQQIPRTQAVNFRVGYTF